jgi:hypothetical protein
MCACIPAREVRNVASMGKPADSSIITVPRYVELAHAIFSPRPGASSADRSIDQPFCRGTGGPWHEHGVPRPRRIGRSLRPNAVELGQTNARGDFGARPEADKVDVAYAELSRRSVHRICGKPALAWRNPSELISATRTTDAICRPPISRWS